VAALLPPRAADARRDSGGPRFPGGAGRADVRLLYGADDVDVRIVDDGATADRSLPGVRERVVLYGGQLRAGERPDGRHGVRAKLPVGGPA
jgi:signal transduction histidine kinase